MLNPILRRREMAARLRCLRTERRLTEEEVAEHMDWSSSKGIRIETGRCGETAGGRDREAVSALDGTGVASDGGLCGSHRKGSYTGGAPGRVQLRARTLALSAVLDEAVLHRVMGGDAVMNAQLEQIIHAADLPNVTLRVIPFNRGTHPAMDSTFSILESTAPCPVRCMLRGP